MIICKVLACLCSVLCLTIVETQDWLAKFLVGGAVCWNQTKVQVSKFSLDILPRKPNKNIPKNFNHSQTSDQELTIKPEKDSVKDTNDKIQTSRYNIVSRQNSHAARAQRQYHPSQTTEKDVSLSRSVSTLPVS